METVTYNVILKLNLKKFSVIRLDWLIPQDLQYVCLFVLIQDSRLSLYPGLEFFTKTIYISKANLNLSWQIKKVFELWH